MRNLLRILLPTLVVAGVCSQSNGSIMQRVSFALSAGSTVFKAGKTEGVCRCGDGANTQGCKDAIADYCKDNSKTAICQNAATFADINATQVARVSAGKKMVDYLITECEYLFPNKTSGCDCIEDFDSTKCNHAAWEACRRGNTMCPAMHYGEAGGAASMESFGRFIEKACGKGLAITEMTMKYEEMNETTWKKDVAQGTATSLGNITGLPPFMISSMQEQVTEGNQEPITGGGRKLLASGWVQKQVTKMVVKYTMRSMMKKQSGVAKSLNNAAASNGQGFFNAFEQNGVTARPFMSSPVVNNGAWFGGPLGAAPAASTAKASSSGSKSGLTGGQIAGIVIGAVLGALLLGLIPLLCCFLCAKRRKKQREAEVKHEYVRSSGDVEAGQVAKVEGCADPDARTKDMKDPHMTTRPTELEDDDVHYRDVRTKKAGLAAAGVGAAGLGAAALAAGPRPRNRTDGMHDVDDTTDINAVRRTDLADPSRMDDPRIQPEGTSDDLQELNKGRRINTDDIDGRDGVDSKVPIAGVATGAAAFGAGALGAGNLASHGSNADDDSRRVAPNDANTASAVIPDDEAAELGTVRDPYAKVNVPVRPDADTTTATFGASSSSGAADGMPTPKRTPTVYERVVSAVQTVKDSSTKGTPEPRA